MRRCIRTLAVLALLVATLAVFAAPASAASITTFSCEPPRTGTGYSADIRISNYPYTVVGVVVLLQNSCGQRAAQVIPFQGAPYLLSFSATIRDQWTQGYTAYGMVAPPGYSTQPVWTPAHGGPSQACGTINMSFGSGSACTSGYH